MSDKKGRDRKAVTSDPRFAGVHSDPRFRLPKKKRQDQELDERFTSALQDDRFKHKTKIDKYGRKIDHDKKLEEAKRYMGAKDAPKGESSSSEGSESESDSDDEEVTGVSAIDRARGEGVSDSESSSEGSDSDSDSDSDSSEEEVDEEEEILIPEPEQDQDQEAVPLGEETKRFAAVNLDWDHIRAVDLMATFSSFAPKRGRVLSVTIYPSEYGKQQMAKEDLHGPSSEFFKNGGNNKKKEKEKEKEINEKTIIEEGNAEEEYSSSTLRKYQLQRLRYYYAVVECDSIVTARTIFDNVDGNEYERTSNYFDLRYVPDEVDFDDEPRDQCTKVPADFKPSEFSTDALQHSKVKLTWDETPAERRKVTQKKYSQKELEQMDLDAYIASASESEDEDDNQDKIALLKQAVSAGMPKLGSSTKDDAAEDGNIEITFNPDEDSKQAENENTEETTLEAYKRKQKERKQKRLAKIKAEKEEQQQHEQEQKAESESKKSKKKQKQDAEMELLAMDDNINASMAEKKLKEAEEKKSGKKKSRKQQKKAEVESNEVDVSTNDDRFSELFSDPKFAIDTTSSQYKKTAASDKIMAERRKRHNTSAEDDQGHKKKKSKKVAEPSGPVNVSSIVQKLKARNQNQKASLP